MGIGRGPSGAGGRPAGLAAVLFAARGGGEGDRLFPAAPPLTVAKAFVSSTFILFLGMVLPLSFEMSLSALVVAQEP